eukprot:Colp12_sorted_trinity150504_noHs@16292
MNTTVLKEGIRPYFLKEMNALLLKGQDEVLAMDRNGQIVRRQLVKGQYKIQPNSVLGRDGVFHEYVDPILVPAEMETLCAWINERFFKFEEFQAQGWHPIMTAAIAHLEFVRIHPFQDGNGRGARLLMNLLLIKLQCCPVVIDSKLRHDYLSGLCAADKGNPELFIHFIFNSLEKTLDTILASLQRF